jgi:transposase InsO family protein
LPNQSPGTQHESTGQLLGQAVAEPFFSSLKKERIKKRIYKNREIALAVIADYIESFYNRTRRHSHLGQTSSEEFEAAAKGCRRRKLPRQVDTSKVELPARC